MLAKRHLLIKLEALGNTKNNLDNQIKGLKVEMDSKVKTIATNHNSIINTLTFENIIKTQVSLC